MTNSVGTGAFDLITTADDYAQLWAGVLRGDVLSPESLRQMFTPQKLITSSQGVFSALSRPMYVLQYFSYFLPVA